MKETTSLDQKQVQAFLSQHAVMEARNVGSDLYKVLCQLEVAYRGGSAMVSEMAHAEGKVEGLEAAAVVADAIEKANYGYGIGAEIRALIESPTKEPG